MKRLLVLAWIPMLALLPASAAVLLDDPFDYPDGVLTVVSQGGWRTHGGTSNQIQVAAGRAILTQTQSEDVNALLDGGPYRGPVLYAGLVVKATSLPSGEGAYFAHFKDGTSTGFRGRIYATTNGAAAGRWRTGIATGAGAPVTIPRDLDLGTDYRLVLRYDTGVPGSTLWINPVSETSVQDRAEAGDAATALSIAAFALRQALAAGAGMGTLEIDRLRVGTSFLEVAENFDPLLDPPALGPIADQSIAANTSTPAVPLLIWDQETAADNLRLRAASDHPELVAVSGVVFGGGGSNRTVTVTPTPGRQGAARVTVTVTDADGNTANGTFQVTVGVPSLSSIAEQSVPQDASIVIPFQVGDREGDALTLWATSTNQTLVTEGDARFGGTGSDRTLALQPAPGLAGLTWITIYVSDGFNVASNSFLLTVFPVRGSILSESFSYLDGSIITNSQLAWTTHSASTGQTGQTQVIQGRLVLSGAQSEDIHRGLGGAPYAPAGAWMLYAGMNVTLTTRPSGGGDFFAHFRGLNSGSSARLFATSTGAAAGRFRFGLANNAAGASAVFPADLETNVTYHVVTRLNVATGQSILWVNPAAEADPGSAAADDPSPFDIWSYAFRQSGGIGALLIDDLQIGTSFADATGYRLGTRRQGTQLELSWPEAAAAAGFHLQSSDTAAGTWEGVDLAPELSGDRLLLVLPLNGAGRFFRLSK